MIKNFPLIAALLLLCSCAKLSVELRQRPYQGGTSSTVTYTRVADESEMPGVTEKRKSADELSSMTVAQLLQFINQRTEEIKLAEPQAKAELVTVTVPSNDRRPEVVKQSKYLWGIFQKAVSAPTPYDYMETKAPLGPVDLLIAALSTELNQTAYYAAQPLCLKIDGRERRESTAEALERAGVTRDNLIARQKYRKKSFLDRFTRSLSGVGTPERIDYSQLQRLRADIGPFWATTFRLLTLGIVWDSGYSNDAETFGLWNEAKAWSWFGKSQFLIMMDSGGNFFVREFDVDPSDTVYLAATLARKAATLALKAQVAGAMLAAETQSPGSLGTKDDELKVFTSTLKAAQQRLETARAAAAEAQVSVSDANTAITNMRKAGGNIQKDLAASAAAVDKVFQEVINTGKTSGDVVAAAQTAITNADDYSKIPALKP